MSFVLALQLSTRDPMFVVMLIIAASFVVIAGAMIVMAVVVSRVVRTVNNLERRAEPLLDRIGVLSEQVREIAVQGKDVAEQVSLMSDHLTTASAHFSESAALIKEEVREIKQLVGYTTASARTQVEKVSATIDRTNKQFSTTVLFIHSKLVQPARELAALMAGVRRGLEVLVSPAPKELDQTYGEEEMFIG
jgi:methyl-accepting chemotaxis protein